MRDSTSIPEGPFEELEEQPPPAKSGLLADPVVRIMVYVSLGLLILFLTTAVGALISGVGAQTGPRSSAERELVLASSTASGTPTAAYVDALIAAGKLPEARLALSQARGSANATTSADLDLSEARIAFAEKQYPETASFAEKAMSAYKAKRDEGVAKGGKEGEAARSRGYGMEYYNAALLKAQALVEIGRWKEAVAAFDIFISVNQTASDILIDRGNAKVELNDKAGAEKDFRAALKYVPYDEEAKAGLKRIGITQ